MNFHLSLTLLTNVVDKFLAKFRVMRSYRSKFHSAIDISELVFIEWVVEIDEVNASVPMIVYIC